MEIYVPHLDLTLCDGMHIQIFNGVYDTKHADECLEETSIEIIKCSYSNSWDICRSCETHHRVIMETLERQRPGDDNALCLAKNIKEIKILGRINRIMEV